MRSRRVALVLAAALSSLRPLPESRAEAAVVECAPSTGDSRPADLRGRWSIELTPDSAISLADARPGRPLGGSVRIGQRYSSSTGIVYSGEYAADFRSVGLARPSGEVLVGVPPGDTVRITLDPSVDHGNLELVGRCRGEQLVGTWTRTGAPARAWGHFVLRRTKA